MSRGGFVIDKDRTTCSKECRSSVYINDEGRKAKISAAFTGSKHPLWQGGGKHRDFRGQGWRAIAEKCRELHERLCKTCGKNEEDNGRKLDVNHIVPFHQWKNNSAANKQSNLEALCKSCHRKQDAKWFRENPTQKTLTF